MVSRHATRIHVCIFDDKGETELYRFVLPSRLGDVHYGVISGITAGARYGLRAEGPWEPANGHRFDVSKLLIDPYATSLDRPFAHHPHLTQRGVDTASLVPKCIAEAVGPNASPMPPAVPGFIYEVQVKAFTQLHPGVPDSKRGTVAVLAEPVIIDHLKALGVDTIELMPLMAWIDERHLHALNLSNAWGYNPVTFMAPDPRLAPGGIAEIRDAVDALHAAGIRVILDVVFNHSGESDEFGATLSFRGLDHALYYRHADGRLVNDTGCGNTVALDRPLIMQLAMDAMRTWVNRTGIDGFRFDLAPVMGRTPAGFDPNAPLLAAIEQDPLLSQCIMIAEPWDVGPGGYRLGQFPPRWHEWNDHYRDDVRRFWSGQGSPGALATRIAGSSDIFAPRRRPSSSINYVAAHDGFTLRDSVTYKTKHNHANGEGNRDGNAHEPVWPGGSVRALLATLFLSRGTPMLTAGDEFGRSQRGNNNAYAQDNQATWLNWAEADRKLIAFTAKLAKLRKEYPLLSAGRFLDGTANAITGLADAQWLGADGAAFDWHDPHAAVLGLVLADGADRIAIWFNRGNVISQPVLPPRDGWRWSRVFTSGEGDHLPPHAVALYAEQRVRQQGISDSTLRELATAANIDRDWWEVDGTHHDVTPETLRTILTALRIPHATPEKAEAALAALRQRRPVPVAFHGGDIVLGDATHRRRRLRINGDDGSSREIEVGPGTVPQAELGIGTYTITDPDDAAAPWPLIVSPHGCHLPDDIAAGARVFGLASHLYALRHHGDGGIGDFETLKRFADVTAKVGGRYAGLNPLHHLFPTDRSRASPYQPSDRRFIDPIYINIARLLDTLPLPRTAKLAVKSRTAFANLETLPNVDYAAVWSAKSAVLEQAFAEFKGDAAFDAFLRQGGADLERHGAFESRLAGEEVSKLRIAYRAFLQWIAEGQLAEAATRGNLYRDLALGSAFDGGEITEAPDDYAHGVSLGAPPDPFSRAGQVWNLPPFSPLALAQASFAPMRTVLAANMRHAAALRIDHILGFSRQFWVPRGAEGRFGAYVNFPVDALIALTAIESRRQRCMIVGEDLGTIPDGLRSKLVAANILSYRVLWFEREGAGFLSAQDYPGLALACLASHDLPTLKGWRAGRDIEIEQSLGLLDAEAVSPRKIARASEIALLDAAAGNASPDLGHAAAAAHGFIARTPSRVMLVQADDLAGEAEPLNVPGTDQERPNWRRRLSVTVDDMIETPLARSIIAAVRTERP